MRSSAFFAQEERVLHVARRVVRREIQRLEVVVVVLDLRSVGDAEPHRDEDRLDLVERLGERMLRAARSGVRPGSVRSIRRRRAAVRGEATAAFCVVQLLHVRAELVEGFAERRAFVRRGPSSAGRRARRSAPLRARYLTRNSSSSRASVTTAAISGLRLRRGARSMSDCMGWVP